MRRSVLVVTCALLVGLAAGFVVPRGDDYFAIKKNFTIFAELYEELAAGYVDPVDPERLMRTGIEAMLQTLDPYTVFIDEADNEDVAILTQGRYGGVGLSIGQRGGRLVVLDPMEGYSGFEQGVRTGDIVVEIAGQPTTDLESLDVRGLLRGAPGSTVEVVVEREGTGRLRFVLTRRQVQLKNVTYAGRVGAGGGGGSVGYVRLERFTQGAGAEVGAAIDSLRAAAPLTGLVLDLRGNPGGLLHEAVNVAGQFVPQGSVIVSTRGRAAETQRVYKSPNAPVAPDLPLVVLVDGGSASASEIVAGAVQDHDRGVVVGERTYGKGLVQTIRPLPYNTSVKFTTSKYYTPSGRLIQAIEYSRDGAGGRAVAVADSLRRAYTTAGGRTVYDGRGIEPDVDVAHGEPSELEAALVRQAAFFLFANRYAAAHPELPADFEVSDQLYAEFEGWAEGQDVEYETRAEMALRALADDLDDAGYGETADEIEALEREVSREKEADFSRHAPRLKERLWREILARYLGDRAEIEQHFRHDQPLERALALLAQPADYADVLD